VIDMDVVGARQRSLFAVLLRPVMTPLVALAMICDVSDDGLAPSCCPAKTATAPATCGVAMEVPDLTA
jgi:hypothetical protein